MAGQFTKLSDRLHLGNAEHCRQFNPRIPTLHIQSPTEAFCGHGQHDLVHSEHGSATFVDKANVVLIWDEYKQDLTHAMLDHARVWFESHAPNPVFIHCAAGLHRSTTFSIAMLMVEGLEFEDAIAKLCKGMARYQFPYPPFLEGDDLRTVRSWIDSVSERERQLE